MLQFIGCGSAFNTSLGNNSAFIKEGNTLFMIDCGSANFDRIKCSGLLEGVEHIAVLLTHTHPDHVGSLGDLIFYGYYCMGQVKQRNITVYAPYSLKIGNLLSAMGVERETYTLMQFDNVCKMEHNEFSMVCQAFPVKHVNELCCYGYILEYGKSLVYYSGDSNYISAYNLNHLHNGTFTHFYQDACKADYEGNVHLSLRELDELVTNNRDRVYCMHLDEGFDPVEATKLGFNVVDTVFEDVAYRKGRDAIKLSDTSIKLLDKLEELKGDNK